MPQQHMNSDKIGQERLRAAEDDYQGLYPNNSNLTNVPDQKISPHNDPAFLSLPPSPVQRLALAIISLVLWVIVFGLIISISKLSTDHQRQLRMAAFFQPIAYGCTCHI